MANFATRITKRTPLVAVPAGSLKPGATVVTRTGAVRIVEGVSRPNRATANVSIEGLIAPLPAHAPILAYVEG